MGSSKASSAVKHVIHHTFDFDREMIFDAWTQPHLLQQWWVADGYSMEIVDSDLRVGGRILYHYISPDGSRYTSLSLYEEVSRPSRFVLFSSFSNEEGLLIPSIDPKFPRVLYMILKFKALDHGTLLTIESMPYEGTETENANFLERHYMMEHTFLEKFEQLESYLRTL